MKDGLISRQLLPCCQLKSCSSLLCSPGHEYVLLTDQCTPEKGVWLFLRHLSSAGLVEITNSDVKIIGRTSEMNS